MQTLFALAIAFLLGTVLQLQNWMPEAVQNLSMVQIALLFVAFIAISYHFHLQKPKLTAPIYAMVMACGLFCSILYAPVYQTHFAQPLQSLDQTTHTVTVVLQEDAQQYDDTQRAQVQVQQAQAIAPAYPLDAFTTTAYLPLTETPLLAGDSVQVALGFYIPTTRNGFDRATYMVGTGQQVWASTATDAAGLPLEFTVLDSEQSAQSFLLGITRTCKQTLQDLLPENVSSLMVAVLFGDTSLLSSADYTNLQRAGMSHMVAVSGMHLSILVGFLYLTCSKMVGTIAAIPLILCMIPMAGSSPSILRAAIMTIITCLCFLLRREGSGLTSYGGALLILLVINPYAIYSLSFQLSFASTLGILVLSSPIQYGMQQLLGKWRNRVWLGVVKFATAAISCTLAATIFTAPLLIYQFGYIALLAPLANLLATLPLTVTFIAGVLLCLTTSVTTLAQPVLVPVVTWGANLLLNIAAWVSQSQYAAVYWSQNWGRMTIVLLCVAIVLTTLCRYKGARIALPLCLLSMGLCAYQSNVAAQNTTTITFHPAGDGQCITIAAGYDTLTVIDCGTSTDAMNAADLVLDYMQWNGFTEIDQLIFTGIDKAHARNAVQLLESVPIGSVMAPAGVKDSETQQAVEDTIAALEIPYETWDAVGLYTWEIAGLEAHILHFEDGKLSIHLRTDAGDVGLYNSLTQLMLERVLAVYPLQEDIFVVAAGKVEDVKLLEAALDIIQPSDIILQSGYLDIHRVNGRPAQNIMLEGAITITTERR